MNDKLFWLLPSAVLASLPAQMEKRESDRYDPAQFALLSPAIGEPAPDLRLCDLEGRPRSLEALLGSTIVLVKGSYT
jgi:hypothetical protein